MNIRICFFLISKKKNEYFLVSFCFCFVTDIYMDDQKYVVFENRFGGQDLEKCKISTMKEALSILKQV